MQASEASQPGLSPSVKLPAIIASLRKGSIADVILPSEIRGASDALLIEVRLVAVGTALSSGPPQSGRNEARTGLRMMPTSPRSPLSFRTAGFPQYGWKAGLSDGAFPGHRPLKPASRHSSADTRSASVLRAP